LDSTSTEQADGTNTHLIDDTALTKTRLV
jgi:hypothetical protein